MAYNPSEPRDPLGKWMKAHGGNPKASLADNVKNLNYTEEHGAAVDTKNTPTAVIDQIAKTGKDEDNRLEALMNPNISDETLDSVNLPDRKVGASVLSAASWTVLPCSSLNQLVT